MSRLTPLLLFLLTAAAPLSANKVTVREDRTLFVDGKPFFPIGLYYAEEEIAEPTGALLKDLRATGFNTVFFHTGGQPLVETKVRLDRIAAAGMHVQFRPPGELMGSWDELEKTVAALKDHPAMLFWEHGDEPTVNKTPFEPSRQGYERMKKLDPDHPVLCVQFPFWKQPEEMRKWGTICDVYAFDKYPVPLKRWHYQGKDIPEGWPHSVAIMGTLTEWWQSLVPGKPVIPVMQAWAWQPTLDGKAGYPTPQQSRFMAYHVVIRGAKGILYYGKMRVSQPHTASGMPPQIDPDPAKAAADFAKAKELNAWFWEGFKPVVKELDEMAPVFTAPDADWKPRVEFMGATEAKPEQIECRVKRQGEGWVILLVNASDHAATVKLTAPQFKNNPVCTWRPGREIHAGEEGSFEEQLEAFAVLVYSDRPPARR
jgi:hypothetical protein